MGRCFRIRENFNVTEKILVSPIYDIAPRVPMNGEEVAIKLLHVAPSPGHHVVSPGLPLRVLLSRLWNFFLHI